MFYWIRILVPALLLTSGSVFGQVSVLATGSASKTSGNTFTSVDLGGFSPPAGTDKLVVIISDEGSNPSSITYNGQSLSRARQAGSGQYAAVYYRDYTSTPASGDLVVNGSDGSGVSILALQGTADGYSTSTSASSSSFSFDALFDDSLVVAGLVANQNGGTYTGTADSPMTALLENANVGSSLGVSGYASVDAGTNNYSFSNLSAGSPRVVAVSFSATGSDTSAPSVTASSISDDGGNPSNNISTDPILTLSFNESVFAGSGSILLKATGGAIVASYDVSSASELSFGVSSLTITPDVLDPATSYYLEIPSGAIEDGSGNTTSYPDNTLEFTTGEFMTVAASGKATYSVADLRGFDPSGCDKLVVVTMEEGGAFPTSISWGASSMTMVTAKVNAGSRSSMWYLDGPFSGPESLSVGGIGSSHGVSLLALDGTSPGFASATNASSTSVSLITTSEASVIVAGYSVNGGDAAIAAPPLYTYFSRNTVSSDGACGVSFNTATGPQTISFSGNSDTPSLVAAEFIGIPPPAGTVIILK